MSKVLFMLPCAGGSAASYEEWNQYIKCPVYSIEYAGHWQRYEEPFYSDAEELVFDVVSLILERVNDEDHIFLFGHSMGGVVAWAVASVLRKTYHKNVQGIFLSACATPNDIKYRKEYSSIELKMILKEACGFSDRVLNSSYFESELQPMYVKDFALLKDLCENIHFDNNILDVDLIGILGDEDSLISKKDMSEWRYLTSEKMECFEFRGDHFYLHHKHNIKNICEIVINTKVKVN